MTIELSDFLIEHLEELCEFIYIDFINRIDVSHYRIISYNITKIDDNLICFDHNWTRDGIDSIYGGTHCFVHPLTKTLYIMHFGDNDNSRQHHKYICDNINDFESVLKRDYKITKLIDDD